MAVLEHVRNFGGAPLDDPCCPYLYRLCTENGEVLMGKVGESLELGDHTFAICGCYLLFFKAIHVGDNVKWSFVCTHLHM